MRKAWLIGRREVIWEILGDRASVLRLGLFALLPLFFVISSRSAGPRSDAVLLTLALQSAFIPALTGVGLIASTFAQEKENQTLVPLLAAPVRDIDIVIGKLLGMLVPVSALSVASIALFYILATAVHGAERVQHALPPQMLYAILVLALFYVLTTGSWVMIVAARVRTSRAAQQMAGLLVGVSVIAFGGLGVIAANVLDGWPLVALGGALVIADVIALDVARRAWQRGEVISHI